MGSAKERARARAGLLCLVYGVLTGLTIWAEYCSYTFPLRDGGINGPLIFRFFTNDSNILMAFTCLLCLPRALKSLLTGQPLRLGRALVLWRFVGTASISLTFWTVMLYLGPVIGYRYMFYHEDLFLHLVDPLLCLGAFIFLEREERLKGGTLLLGTVPMLLYGLWYLREVKAGHWNDFYGFLSGPDWRFVYLGMALATLFLGWLLALAHNRALGERDPSALG